MSTMGAATAIGYSTIALGLCIAKGREASHPQKLCPASVHARLTAITSIGHVAVVHGAAFSHDTSASSSSHQWHGCGMCSGRGQPLRHGGGH